MATLGAIDMKQPVLFDLGHPDMKPTFAGETFDQDRDQARLEGLLGRVLAFMADGSWHLLADIQAACGGTEASCSARLRDLRKPWAGSRTVERRRVPGQPGLFEYRLITDAQSPVHEEHRHDVSDNHDDRPGNDLGSSEAASRAT